MIEIYATVIMSRPDTVLISDGSREAWLPKSEITCDDDDGEYHDGEMMTIWVPEWLAHDRGLI